jgi:hypothetical protein
MIQTGAGVCSQILAGGGELLDRAVGVVGDVEVAIGIKGQAGRAA